MLTREHSELRGVMESLEKNEQQVLFQAREEHSRSLTNLTEELSQESSSAQRLDMLTREHSELRGVMESLEKNEQQVLFQAREEHSRSLTSLAEELSQESSSAQRLDVLTREHSELRGAMEGLEKNEQQVLDQASEEHSRSLISLTEELSQARSEHTLESERVQSLLCERVATNQNEFHLNGLQVELVKQEEELDKARLFEARAFAESAALEVEVA